MLHLQKATPVLLLVVALLLAALLFFPAGLIRPAAAQSPADRAGQMIVDKGNIYIYDKGSLVWYRAEPSGSSGTLRLVSRVPVNP